MNPVPHRTGYPCSALGCIIDKDKLISMNFSLNKLKKNVKEAMIILVKINEKKKPYLLYNHKAIHINKS